MKSGIPESGKISKNSQPKGSGTRKATNSFPCAHCDTMFIDKRECYIHIKIDHKDEYIDIIESQLKEYENQIQALVEDVEKVKTENKELKSMNKMNKSSAAEQSPRDIYDKEDEIELDSEKELLLGKQSGFRREGPQVQSVQFFPCQVCGSKLKDLPQLNIHLKIHDKPIKRCNKCGKTYDNENDFEFHTTYEHKDLSQWNCMNCDFQANSRDNLKNHINFKHTKDTDKVVLNCDKCKMQFRSMWHLRNHKRDDHGKEEECIFYKDKRCKFGHSCWKIHMEGNGIISFTCFWCKETFKSMNELMNHRKKKHIELCKPCNPKQGPCRFANQPERCWFSDKDFPQALNQQIPP